MLPAKEDLNTEFKTSSNEEVIVTLVAFANAKGGQGVCGCERQRRGGGSGLGARVGAEVDQRIKHKTEPSVIPYADIEEVDGKQVVVLSVLEYPIKSVSVKGRYYKSGQQQPSAVGYRNSEYGFADAKHVMGLLSSYRAS